MPKTNQKFCAAKNTKTRIEVLRETGIARHEAEQYIGDAGSEDGAMVLKPGMRQERR